MRQVCLVTVAVVGAVTAVASVVTPATTIRDPNMMLPSIRNFMGQTSFTEAFQCGDTSFMKVFRISCEYQADRESISSMCKDIPEGLPVQRQVISCTDDSVTIYIDATGESVILSSEEYFGAGLSVPELFLETLPQFIGYDSAYLTITSTEHSTYTLGRGTSKERKVPSMNIRGLIGEPDKKGLDILVSITRDVAGIAQVVRLRTEQHSWFLVEDFVTGNTK